MSDKSDDDLGFDPDEDLYDYDEVLDENFEEDLDNLEGLEEEDMDYASVELDPENDFEEFEDLEGWDSGKVDELAAGAAPKKKRHLDLSFNAMAIIAALVVGVFVLGYQVITKKPPAALDMFFSSLNMAGASDGPVFGEGGIEAEMLESDNNTEAEEGKGFLYEPETLNSMEMSMELDIENAPPMPVPVELDETEMAEEPLTPLPSKLDDLYGSETVANDQTPRPPADAGENTGDDEMLAPDGEGNSVEAAATKAEDFLKQAMKEREEQLKENAVVKLELDENTPEEPVVEQEPVAVQEEPAVVEPAPVLENTDIDSIAEAESSEEEPVQAPKSELEPAISAPVTSEPPINVTLAESLPPDVTSRLDRILDRLDDMESEIDKIRQSGNTQIEDISDDIDALKKEMNTLDSRPRAPQQKASVSPAPKKQAAPVKRKTPVAAKKVTWELRAAQPGKAWVSPKGQNRMQPVVVGDSLSGIGLITSISFDGSRWAVQGTSGRINQ